MKKLLNISILILSVLIFAGCVPKSPPMHDAANKGDIETVKKLFNSGHDIEKVYFGTPLIWATAGGHIRVVKFLVEKGANIDAKDTMGRTPLGFALVENKRDVSRYLLLKGANIDNTMKGMNDWLIKYAIKYNITKMIYKIKQAIKELKSIKREELLSQKKYQKISKNKLKSRINQYIINNDLKGLKKYTDENPNSVYYIKDASIRLALTGQKGIKVGDIRKLIKDGKSEMIIVSLIKRVKIPYKEFTITEIETLQSMGLSDKIISTMIDRTTQLMDNEQIKKQQEFLLSEQKKITNQKTKVIYKNNPNQKVDEQGNPIMDKVQDEVINQGVGMLLDNFF